VKSGEWFKSDSEYGPFLHARLGIAEANSGKLVSLLRTQAREIAEQINRDIIIIDGPPGIGCPVIASITGVSHLVIVTEPSLSAIHDMKRLIDLAQHFDILTGLCINKYDINPGLSDQIEKYAVAHNIKLHGKIPFDEKFTEAQLLGRPFVAVASKEDVTLIEAIWKSIKSELNTIENEKKNKKAV
jgi:MinD superfamily P-loop ATPase